MPLPQYAAGFAERTSDGARFGAGGLVDALIADVRGETQVALKQSDFKLETLPAHLFMNFKVIDEHGRQLAMGRNLAQLRAEHGSRAVQGFTRAADTKLTEANGRVLFEDKTNWDFGDLEDIVEVGNLIGYPALADHGNHVNVELFDESGLN